MSIIRGPYKRTQIAAHDACLEAPGYTRVPRYNYHLQWTPPPVFRQRRGTQEMFYLYCGTHCLLQRRRRRRTREMTAVHKSSPQSMRPQYTMEIIMRRRNLPVQLPVQSELRRNLSPFIRSPFFLPDSMSKQVLQSYLVSQTLPSNIYNQSTCQKLRSK